MSPRSRCAASSLLTAALAASRLRQLRMDLRGHDENGELTAQSIERNQRHGDQENGRDYSDENVGHDQAIAQAPQNSAPEPAKSEEEEQDTRRRR